ncbi:hypothetical protein [Micromonospora schwarzwaldensis]|uniref:hypothetical protein n=1 Tax=Micromonospora sp. DSM 45708 TaxID=3111767 RepID=UPI0031D4AE2D
MTPSPESGMTGADVRAAAARSAVLPPAAGRYARVTRPTTYRHLVSLPTETPSSR